MLLVHHLNERDDELLIAILHSRERVDSPGLRCQVVFTSWEEYGPHGSVEVVQAQHDFFLVLLEALLEDLRALVRVLLLKLGQGDDCVPDLELRIADHVGFHFLICFVSS